MIRPNILVATGIAIGLVTSLSHTAVGQSAYMQGGDDNTALRPELKPLSANSTISAQCPGPSVAIDCNSASARQQAHVTLALLFLGIQDRCADGNCRLSIRSIQR